MKGLISGQQIPFKTVGGDLFVVSEIVFFLRSGLAFQLEVYLVLLKYFFLFCIVIFF